MSSIENHRESTVNTQVNENSILTPNGELADSTDRVMLLVMWGMHIKREKDNGAYPNIPDIILACIGKPTFPGNEYAVKSIIKYWNTVDNKIQRARGLLNHSHMEQISDEVQNEIAELSAAVGYGEPQGELNARIKMSVAMNSWYGNTVKIEEQNILFTVGGVAGLKNIFSTINREFPNSYILTPCPYYPRYKGSHGENNLYLIPVMQERGYRLSAELLDSTLALATTEALKKKVVVSALLLGEPNNPLGTVLNKIELENIANVLRKYPNLLIILDEVYSEMRFSGDPRLSLLNVAPDLKDRMIIMRSATKSLSLPGERMGIIIAFNKNLMTKLVQENIFMNGHAPISLQHAYADAMNVFKDDIELKYIKNYYQPQVQYMAERLRKMGAAMPDPEYKVDATFYILANLIELCGLDIPKSAERVLNKTGKIMTDEDIAYFLLFKQGLGVTPLSYYGAPKDLGILRITCSGGKSELKKIADRLEQTLIEARILKKGLNPETSKIAPQFNASKL